MGHLKVMAGIGAVCVQWALLEHTLLGIIASIETMPIEKVYRIFGSLDMRPRCDMAMGLAIDARVPTALWQRIKAISKALRDEKLFEKRNQAVHGVHAATEVADAISLTMPRWPLHKRVQIVTVVDLYHLTKRLNALANEAVGVRDEIANWKGRVLQNRLDDAKHELAIANTPVLFKLAKHTYARAQRLWWDFKS